MNLTSKYLSSRWVFGILAVVLFIACLDKGYQAYSNPSLGWIMMSILYGVASLISLSRFGKLPLLEDVDE